MKRILLVTFAFVASPKTTELEPVFNKASDWLRYASNCWLVCTTSSPQVWMQRIKPHLEKGDQVFIVEVDLEKRSGWLNKWVWEWINKQVSIT